MILKRIRAVRSLLRGAEYFRTEKGVSIFKKSGGLQHALHDFTLAKPVNVQRVDAEDGVCSSLLTCYHSISYYKNLRGIVVRQATSIDKLGPVVQNKRCR